MPKIAPLKTAYCAFTSLRRTTLCCLDVLHDIARLDQQTPVFLYYENKLLKEATEQNNLRYQSLATYEHIIYFFNKLDLKTRNAVDEQNGSSGREA